MSTILVIAPHPDDETLGCGGTLLRHISEGDNVHWLIVTSMDSSIYTSEQMNFREKEIKQVNEMYGFTSTTQLGYPASCLDQVPTNDIVQKLSDAIKKINPHTIYTVFRNDAHSDHQVVFDSLMSATKSFRNPGIKKIMSFETLSETDFSNPLKNGFRPNIFINIEDFLQRKLEILSVFDSEMGDFPFPRSPEAIKSLAAIRGVQATSKAAEAFILIKEIK